MKSNRLPKSGLTDAPHCFTGSGCALLLAAMVALAPQSALAKNKPEISVEQPSRSSMKDGVAKRDFGTITLGKTSHSKEFLIRNMGYARLSGLRIAKGGSDVADFVVGPLKGGTSLSPGASAIFKVQFKPTAKGRRTATLRIFSNDSNENPFDITLTGEGGKRASAP